MKRNILTTIIIILFFVKLNAQEIEIGVYEGKMNEKMPIALYLQSQEHGCTTERMYGGMYKYIGVSKWLQLKITKNDENQFVLVEYGFTGLMILKKTTDGFDGVWISPDSKKQLKIKLKKVEISDKKTEELEDTFETINHGNNDC